MFRVCVFGSSVCGICIFAVGWAERGEAQHAADERPWMAPLGFAQLSPTYVWSTVQPTVPFTAQTSVSQSG